MDDYVIAEARRNLAAEGPDAVPALDALLGRFQASRSVPSPDAEPVIDWLPEKDRPVLASAIRLRCDALLTGDRAHFGAGYARTFGGVTVHAPRSLAEKLLG